MGFISSVNSRVHCNDKAFLDTNTVIKQLHTLVYFAGIELDVLLHLHCNLVAYDYIDEHELYKIFKYNNEKALPLFWCFLQLK